MDLIEQTRVLLEYRESVEEPAVYIKWFLQPSGYLWWVLLDRLESAEHTQRSLARPFSVLLLKKYTSKTYKDTWSMWYSHIHRHFIFFWNLGVMADADQIDGWSLSQLNHQGLDQSRIAWIAWQRSYAKLKPSRETACERSSRSTLKCQRNWRSYEALGWKTL